MQLAAAYLLDLLLGDPPRLPHPVVLMGRLIACLDRRWYRIGCSPKVLLWRGVLLVFCVTGAVFLSALLGLKLLCLVWQPAAQAAGIYLLYSTLAARGLGEAGLAVRRPLAAGALEEARHAVSRIVGRDTAGLTEAEVARAAVETVAENTVDGVTAPMFYALLGGAPLALAYRAVNTLDSMLGYKSERYLYFGRAAARLDDLANWLPARLTVPVMYLSAGLLHLDNREGWRTLRRDGKKHPSPNSGLAEAFAAGALGVTLGGENCYGGVVSVRPRLGKGRPPRAEDIAAAVRLMHVTSLLFLVLGLGVRALFTLWRGGF